jgi:hypothetical protein
MTTEKKWIPVGAKVKATCNWHGSPDVYSYFDKFEFGTLVQCDFGSCPYLVDFPDGESNWYYEEEIEMIEEEKSTMNTFNVGDHVLVLGKIAAVDNIPDATLPYHVAFDGSYVGDAWVRAEQVYPLGDAQKAEFEKKAALAKLTEREKKLLGLA